MKSPARIAVACSRSIRQPGAWFRTLPRKRTFEDFETAAKAMRDSEERKESIFRQSVEAEKNKQDLFDKKFAEAMRKAKESPQTGKPLRDIDLD